MEKEQPLSDRLYQLESRLHQPQTRHSHEQLTELLSEEFVEFSSFGKVYNREQIIASLAKESSIRISMGDFKCVQLASSVALVIYRATIADDDQPARDSLRSSIWKLEDCNWRMVFHQGTPVRME